jgi:hypothetical protein
MICNYCNSRRLKPQVVDLDGLNLVDMLVCQKCGHQHPDETTLTKELNKPAIKLNIVSTKPYILSKLDKKVITKICNARFVGITKLKDLHDIIDILNSQYNQEEYGTFGYLKEIKCDLCLVNDDYYDLLIYGENDKKYWLSKIIDLPDTYSTKWIITAIQSIIQAIDNYANSSKPVLV